MSSTGHIIKLNKENFNIWYHYIKCKLKAEGLQKCINTKIDLSNENNKIEDCKATVLIMESLDINSLEIISSFDSAYTLMEDIKQNYKPSDDEVIYQALKKLSLLKSHKKDEIPSIIKQLRNIFRILDTTGIPGKSKVTFIEHEKIMHLLKCLGDDVDQYLNVLDVDSFEEAANKIINYYYLFQINEVYIDIKNPNYKRRSKASLGNNKNKNSGENNKNCNKNNSKNYQDEMSFNNYCIICSKKGHNANNCRYK